MNETAVSPRSLTCAETAKALRGALKAAFPGVKFSVRSDTYSMGASINVGWVDGPTQAEVARVSDGFQGGGFDGMIDLAYDVVSYIAPDGTAGTAASRGTEGSGGCHAAFEANVPEGSEIVTFGADHVFANRSLSDEFSAEIAAAIVAESGVEIDPHDGKRPPLTGGEWFEGVAFRGRALHSTARGMVWQASTEWSKYEGVSA